VTGVNTATFGAHAQFVIMSQDGVLTASPSNLTDAESAAVFDGSVTALPFLRDRAALRPGQSVLINGAAGSVGTAAVQIAKHWGAHVTGVASTRNLELVRSLGADDVIDYTGDDLTTRGPIFDVVIDAVGKYAFHWGKRALKPGGVYVETDFGPHKLETLVMWPLSRWVGGRRLRFGSGRRSKADVEYMRELIEAGGYRPVIDQVYPIEQIVEAHRRVESWHKVGNVVVTL
jgi:NADPH:quinone reductase-like Zn-dependent oxidoreductase